MNASVLTVGPETPLADVHRLFVEEQIGAAPVVDEAERVVGVVSASDLLRAMVEERDTAVVDADYLREDVPYSAPDWDHVPEDLQDRLAQRRVSDVMTAGIASVPPEASAAEVALTLRKHRIHHLFVVEEGTLCGVISTWDLLQLVESGGAR